MQYTFAIKSLAMTPEDDIIEFTKEDVYKDEERLEKEGYTCVMTLQLGIDEPTDKQYRAKLQEAENNPQLDVRITDTVYYQKIWTKKLSREKVTERLYDIELRTHETIQDLVTNGKEIADFDDITLKFSTLKELSQQLDKLRSENFVKLENYEAHKDDKNTLKAFKDLVLRYHRRPDIHVQVIELDGSQELWVKNRYF